MSADKSLERAARKCQRNCMFEMIQELTRLTCFIFNCKKKNLLYNVLVTVLNETLHWFYTWSSVYSFSQSVKTAVWFLMWLCSSSVQSEKITLTTSPGLSRLMLGDYRLITNLPYKFEVWREGPMVTRHGESKQRCYPVALWELWDIQSLSLTRVFNFYGGDLLTHQRTSLN